MILLSDAEVRKDPVEDLLRRCPAGDLPEGVESLADLQGDEFANIPLALDYKSDAFHLWIPEEKARYDSIMDRVVNGWFMQHRRFEKWIDEQCGLYVWLEWVQIYGETPAGKVPGSGFDDSQSQTITFGLGQGTV